MDMTMRRARSEARIEIAIQHLSDDWFFPMKNIAHDCIAIDAMDSGQRFLDSLIDVFSNHIDRIAVVDGETTYKYSELLHWSLSVASEIRKLDLPDGSIIAVAMDKTRDYVVSLLGALFAGHSFLPIDTKYPSSRIGYMMEDANVRCVLHDSRFGYFKKKAGRKPHLINVSDVHHRNSGEICIVSNQDIVYTIYTSGTTGNPKGVPIHADGLANFLSAQGKYLAVSHDSRFASVSSVSFDMSIWEIFLALWHGASIAMLSRDAVIDGRMLRQALNAHEITHVLMTPSMLSTMPAADYPYLRHVVSAGEECNADLVALWSDRCNFYDAYGATEATIYTTITRKTPETDINDVGQPMRGTGIVIIDDSLNEIKNNAIGEIGIMGAGVSRGYRNRPELSEKNS
jgi:amino acid adenylation domain-containing protein